MNTQVPKVELFSVPISITPLSGALAVITRWVMKWREARSTKHEALKIFPHASRLMPRAKIVTTPNPEMIVAAQKDSKFLKALQSADLAIPDGVGVVWAIQILGNKLWVLGRESGMSYEGNPPNPSSQPYPKPITHDQLYRISGLSLMESLIAFAAQNGWRVMLVGGKPGVAVRAAKRLKSWVMSSGLGCEDKEKRGIRNFFPHNSQLSSHPTTYNPQLSILGFSGPDDITHASPHDLDRLIISINRVKPDLLFVAFGHGKQEKWMARYRNRLDVGVMMGVGGALDQTVDPSLRPPAYIDSIGLGWLYRLVRDPWRWRRQLALVKFTAMVLRVFFRSI